MGKQDHTIIKKYLEQHSFVESNITSFNNFIDKKMQQIVDELNETIPKEESEIKLGKIRIERPNIIEADGSTNLIAPTEARLRNLTYSAPVFLEIGVKMEGQFETYDVEIGRLPIFVKSKICNLNGLSKEELDKENIDPLETGGYFIINGNERIITMTEDLAENQPFIEMSRGKLQLRLFSKRGSYKIPISITETNEGILEVSFSRFKNIPAMMILKALGMIKESDIAQLVQKETDSLIVNLYEYTNIASSEDAMMAIAEKVALQGTKKEILDRVKQRIDSYFMPHIGTRKEDRIEKARTLCKFIKQFLIAKENPATHTDKDHYANKRVRLSGDLLEDLFRVNLNILVRDIQYSLQKIAKRKKFYSIKTIAKSTLFSHRIESAIATGSWIGERTGVTQNMDKTNCMSILSQLQKVSSMLSEDQENFLARTLHPTHYGRFCPIETPEGGEIGLRKNLALLARISTAVNMNDEDLIEKFKLAGMKEGKYDVFFNGRFIGGTENGEKFCKEIREIRRKTLLPSEMSIRLDKYTNTIYISTEVGRVLRPLIIVENGESKYKDEHALLLEQDKISWNDLLSQGIIEYIDASEEENVLVALKKEDITPEHTHMEVEPVASLGIINNLVPFANHNHPPRLLRGSKTIKQALGIYAANYPIRIDTDVSVLHYPQRPVVRSFVYDKMNIYPSGQNIVVAVITHDGYNMEDAMIINKGSVDRGFGRSTYFRSYLTKELNYPGGLADEICIPEKDTSGYMTEESYKHLEDDGIIYPEAKLSEGEAIIGKVSPPKFLSEAREISIRTKKESSTLMRQEEKGIVDFVLVTSDSEGNKVIQVRVRDHRIPEPGDKFSAPHGQKGVIGAIINENDVPFTSRGIKPDLIFNPHGIPSRMSVGYMMELLAGKVGCVYGKPVDATAFAERDIENFEKDLEEKGFRYDGKETMYDPITGKMLKAKIFIGNMYYRKLKYMVANKIHARASGKVTLLTRQPVEGRAKGGALRLGEMEQQALIAHGASLLLKERYDSDKVIAHICSRCGGIAIKDSIRKKIICPSCNSAEIEPVEIPYAFKLLIEELQSLNIMTHFELKNKYE